MADIAVEPNKAAQEPERRVGPRPETYFPAPALQRGEFEIALVLGGTVSVGTFTAGVLDFLFEALDAWSTVRQQEDGLPPEKWTVPHHKVRVRVLTGTSGGGVSSLLAARALHYDFPPARDSQTEQKLAANPFYSVWVNYTDITQFLNDDDLQNAAGGTPPPITAVLNGKVLETIANGALRYPSPEQAADGPVALRPLARDWINNPLPIVLTQTHLTGIPYKVDFRGDGASYEYFTNHADYVRFYANYNGPSNPGVVPLLPDAIVLGYPDAPSAVGAGRAAPLATANLPTTPWSILAQYALGTAAFPLGLPARRVARNAGDYDYRFVLDTVTNSYQWIQPDNTKLMSTGMTATTYSFTALDGGCCDNEPIALGRQMLEGLSGAAANDAVNTRRAVFLVDPFCEIPPNAVSDPKLALTSLLGPTVHMFVSSNRFATTDLINFLHPHVYNRYLIAPKRNRPATFPADAPETLMGGDALCGDGLGGFLGFLAKDFRRTDFLLGRRNCQSFLKWTLTFDDTNFSFLAEGPKPPRYNDGKHVVPDNERPLIPLVGNLSQEIKETVWPNAGSFDIGSIEDLLKKRLTLIFERAETFLNLNPLGKFAFQVVTKHFLVNGAFRKIGDAVKSELDRKHL